MKEEFLKIAKKRMKGIVSQAKKNGERPYWIVQTLWDKMWVHWKTPEAVERSTNASNCRYSDRDGFGFSKHVAGQKSFLQIEQDMVRDFFIHFNHSSSLI